MHIKSSNSLLVVFSAFFLPYLLKAEIPTAWEECMEQIGDWSYCSSVAPCAAGTTSCGGSLCCPSDSYCAAPLLCCPTNTIGCGKVCCPASSICGSQEKSTCCPVDTSGCGSTCCPSGSFCANSATGMCCPSNTFGCGVVCCLSGTYCNQGRCSNTPPPRQSYALPKYCLSTA